MAGVVQRDCEQCGVSYGAKRRDFRFCGGVCRNRHRRSPAFALLHPQAACRVVFLTFCRRWLLRLAELDAAGRLNTTKGQLVLNLGDVACDGHLIRQPVATSGCDQGDPGVFGCSVGWCSASSGQFRRAGATQA